jgi:outer membrane protein assembly factor BamC
MTGRISAAGCSALLFGLLVLAAGGCSKSIVPTKKVDYKSASQAQTTPLEVPPDLPKPATNDRYSLPEGPSRSTATYSEYRQDRPARAQTTGGVLPAVQNAHIERAGTQRWLVVDVPPESVWPVLREFWQEMGFLIAVDNPELGVMETDWAENRAKIPQSVVRNLIGKVLDQAYSTPELDRFKVRVERGAKAGSTEVYVTHRGAYEMYVADANLRQTGRTVWQPRQPDPNLEAEMLTRLMVRLGTPETVAATEVKQAKIEPRATLLKGPDGVPVLTLKDDFDRAWRRVGLSLDRLGFSVQDVDRAAGLYYIRYLNPPAPSKDETGFLDRLAFWKKDSNAGGKPEDYRVAVAGAEAGTQVTVLSSDGKADKSEAAARMLTVLQEDLR